MKFLHVLNATAYLANAIVWAVYARVPFMAIVSGGACLFALYLARQEQ